MESKAWDWKKVKGSNKENIWIEPSVESYYLINRWKNQNKKEFLDLGCGLGRHTVQFAKSGFKTCSMDLSETSVEETKNWCKNENLDVNFVVGDMLKLPYEEDQFDCILSYNVINHTDTNGIKKIISELYRVLKTDGEAYLTLTSKETWGWKQDHPLVDENTKIKMETEEENGIPHFYADYNLILELFKDFKIEDLIHNQKIYERDGVIRESWHYHILISKT